MILSDPAGDAHVDFVVAELERRGQQHFIFDPSEYPANSTITIESTTSNGPCTFIKSGEGQIDVGQLAGAWYRRPGKPVVSMHMDEADAAWTREECAHALNGLYELIPFTRWVSHPKSIARASVKLWQLHLAQGLGFKVPEYVLTNDPDRASSFLATHQAVVAKALAEPYVLYADCNEVVVLYTQRIGDLTLEDLSSVRNGPTFLQKYVDKEADVRVTVVGSKVFAVEIDTSDRSPAIVDYRAVEALDLPHRAVRLPSVVESACVSLVEQLGLAFGAIDLVKDRSGKYFFLEINPNGQWMWLQWAAGVPICEALCDRLAGRRTD